MSVHTGGYASTARGTEPPWFESWFGEDYLSVYPHRDEREAELVVALLARKLAGKKVDRVLDLACGAGRHSRVLSGRWWTTGLDLSQTLLSLARSERPEGCYVRGDMRVLPFRERSFSLVVNLFTSFGYFPDDGDHQRVLDEVFAVMERGAIFALDYLNAGRVVENLKASDEALVNGLVVQQERRVTADGRFVEKKISLPAKNKSFVERVRLFSRADLETLLRNAGFHVEEAVGDYSGGPWTDQSERTMLLSSKP